EDRRAALLEPEENLSLGLSDFRDRFEKLEMRRSNGRDDSNMRPHQLYQRRNLPRMVHADLEHAKLRFAWEAGEHQRHAPVIVEALDRPVGLSGSAENG